MVQLTIVKNALMVALVMSVCGIAVPAEPKPDANVMIAQVALGAIKFDEVCARAGCRVVVVDPAVRRIPTPDDYDFYSYPIIANLPAKVAVNTQLPVVMARRRSINSARGDSLVVTLSLVERSATPPGTATVYVALDERKTFGGLGALVRLKRTDSGWSVLFVHVNEG